MRIHASTAAALALALALAGTAAAQTNPDSSTTGKSAYGTPSTTGSTSTSGSLPRTASPMPLFTLLGSAATAAGVWLSQRRPRH